MEGMQQNGHENKPRDTFHITYMIHFILGAGNLLPWNSFVTAVDYFEYLYPNKHVDKVFSVAYMVSASLVLVALVCLSNSKMLPSFRMRMTVAQFLFILALITPLVTDQYSNRKETDVTFAVLVLAVVVSGVADGLTIGGLIGAAAELPERYMQATVAGNASSGVLVGVIRIITKASLPHSAKGLRFSTQIYFIISTSMIFLCLLIYNLRHKLPVVKYHKQQLATITNYDFNGEKRLPTWEVIKTVRHAVVGILILYIVTLSIFPGYLSENVRSSFFSDWYPILLLTTFCVGDLFGKMLAALYIPKSIYKTMWFCMGRVGFYPLFAACAFGPKWLRSEFPVIFLTLALGFTNGFFTSILMILAPKSVPVQLSERVAIVMSMFLMTGLAIGSFLGWLWNI